MAPFEAGDVARPGPDGRQGYQAACYRQSVRHDARARQQLGDDASALDSETPEVTEAERDAVAERQGFDP
jgi:hypothetical protein